MNYPTRLLDAVKGKRGEESGLLSVVWLSLRSVLWGWGWLSLPAQGKRKGKSTSPPLG